MSFPAAFRSFLPLTVGLALGAVGTTLLLESLPGPEGSPEERARNLEVELGQVRKRLEAAEAAAAPKSVSPGLLGRLSDPRGRRELSQGARQLADDIRAGRPVSPDDIFRATQPLLRDLAPLFDRMREKEQAQLVDRLAGELAREYQLTADAQAQLKQWFKERCDENAEAWNDLIERPDATMKDLVRASRDMRIDSGIDDFLPQLLSPEQGAAFAQKRLAERDRRVQVEADRRVERLNNITPLDAAQRDQIFGLMARSSRDYDPSMVLQDSSGQPLPSGPVDDREAAVLAVLRPDQREAYAAEQKRQREEAAKDMAAIGLTLPEDWRMIDDDEF